MVLHKNVFQTKCGTNPPFGLNLRNSLRPRMDWLVFGLPIGSWELFGQRNLATIGVLHFSQDF
jgi:hypothetical protein